MRKRLHRYLGHKFHLVPRAGTPVFECGCGEHWWVGFGHYHLTQRDTFVRYL